MSEFFGLFTLIIVAVSVFDGISEGLLLKTDPVNYKGTGEDRIRKSTDGIEFVLGVMGMLIVVMQFGTVGLHDRTFVSLVVYALSIRWLLRDGIQNMITGKGFFYSGTVAFLDRMINEAPTWFKVGIKVTLVLISLMTSLAFLP